LGSIFTDEAKNEDTIVAWSPKPFAYVRVNNEKGLVFYDVYGVKREVQMDPVRTKSLPVPVGESPVYVVVEGVGGEGEGGSGVVGGWRSDE
jgi:hypothetical protein